MPDSIRPDGQRSSVYCVWCLRSHEPPVAVAVNDGCSSQPDLIRALADSLTEEADRG
jgi:hypothetical protein